jgi:RimJ/RimL family protein N-acetyltransferase
MEESEESTTSDKGVVALRPTRAADEAFLLQVYTSSREQEMALVSWDAAQREAFLKLQFTAQQQHYNDYFPDSDHSIIELDGEPVGRLYVARTDEEIRLLDITILPRYRGAGLGTPIIEGVMAEAARACKPVRVYVEYYNPSRRLFERLGFYSIEESGINIRLEWSPKA